MKAKAQRVKAVRQATGLNQEDFAKALGVSTSIVAKVESEAASADNLLSNISKKLGISIENILNGNIPKEIVLLTDDKNNPWRDALVNELKEEVSYYRELLKIMASGKSANFLKGIGEAPFAKYLPGKRTNTVRAAA